MQSINTVSWNYSETLKEFQQVRTQEVLMVDLMITDNSGTLQYISIRHGGTDIGAGNEINGLTLGGVGSGTTIESH